MAFADHTIKGFDSDLQILSRTLAEMGGLAERQVAEAIKALTNGDRESARQLVAADASIDSMQRMIDKRVVASRSPSICGKR